MMSSTRQVMDSDYMHWAKTRSRARFNLATSGVANVSMDELSVTIRDLEITRDGGYGYEPLQQALAERYRVDVDSIAAATGTSLANHLAMASLVKPPGPVTEIFASFRSPTYHASDCAVRAG